MHKHTTHHPKSGKQHIMVNHDTVPAPVPISKTYTAPAPVVMVRDGKVVTSSLDVATFFKKRHDNVVSKIDGIRSRSNGDHLLNFKEVPAEVTRPDGSTINVRSYDLTKDGFAFLVNGFSGERAEKFRWAYIREFNRMEAALKAAPVPAVPALPDFTNPAIAARAWADQFDRAEGAEKVARRLLAFPHSVGVREAAKMLKLPPQELSRMLREWKWTYVQGGGKRTVTLAYQSVIDRGWMVHDAYVTPDGRTVYHPKITPDGISKIARMTPAND